MILPTHEKLFDIATKFKDKQNAIQKLGGNTDCTPWFALWYLIFHDFGTKAEFITTKDAKALTPK
ncbi:uncharacterized protein PHALS_03614 [Plasmopara halstedii]|uniref:Uncharacterized protein n=1 Tax=Plasmopara halstedii TaxID=4781 RepID=A0A0P1B121_PLAHL|nr:uncharacterized protein PHALS_03614 [Plasmopara halstedii]CEG46945.1 hypothetical protein PHALS_03614 [Plasmopara halstedii]|eukprot:XP_024583314.1 hypothetical protein PHALS_03614 [Plasmopara halstedii]